MSFLPAVQQLSIQFAHESYRLAERFALLETGIRHFQTWTPEDAAARIVEADVLVVSGLWRGEWLASAPRLKFIQVCAAGYDQFDTEALAARGVRLASGSGVNRNAVSEHAMALILVLVRHLHTGRDNQRRQHWRGMISALDQREDELGGKTVLIYGLGAIGSRLARLAKAFDMRVIGIKRDPSSAAGDADEVHPPEAFSGLLEQADFLVLTCPLTPTTENLVDRRALAAMKPTAYLVNVARGGCVDQDALIAALEQRAIAGAAVDTVREEPLPDTSPLWNMENVIITPHTGGETRAYEDNVSALLLENLERLWRGDSQLVNQVV